MTMYPNETQTLADTGLSSADIDHSVIVHLGDARIKRVLRIRLLTDPGFPVWDLSYAWAELHDGSKVRLDIGVHQIRKGKGSINGKLIDLCNAVGVNGKRIGIFDAVSCLW